MEADAVPAQILSVTTQVELKSSDKWIEDILQTACASGPQVPDFAALLPDSYDWDAYVKQHFCKLLQQVWQAQNEVYDAKAAALTERQQYTAEKQKNEKQFERQLAESQLYVKALDAESDRLQQNALALEKENQALQLYLKQIEDARIADRQKALRQYLLTAQSMGMDFAASQV